MSDPEVSVAARELCLVYLVHTRRGMREVLLGIKLRGFGEGRVVAPGGKVDAGESPHEAAARELREETGLVVAPEQLSPRGVVTFVFAHAATPDLRTHVFVLDADAAPPSGRLRASDELDAQWMPVDDLPWPSMWADAHHWLPTALERPVGDPTFWYATDGVSIDRMEL